MKNSIYKNAKNLDLSLTYARIFWSANTVKNYRMKCRYPQTKEFDLESLKRIAKHIEQTQGRAKLCKILSETLPDFNELLSCEQDIKEVKNNYETLKYLVDKTKDIKSFIDKVMNIPNEFFNSPETLGGLLNNNITNNEKYIVQKANYLYQGDATNYRKTWIQYPAKGLKWLYRIVNAAYFIKETGEKIKELYDDFVEVLIMLDDIKQFLEFNCEV